MRKGLQDRRDTRGADKGRAVGKSQMSGWIRRPCERAKEGAADVGGERRRNVVDRRTTEAGTTAGTKSGGSAGRKRLGTRGPQPNFRTCIGFAAKGYTFLPDRNNSVAHGVIGLGVETERPQSGFLCNGGCVRRGELTFAYRFMGVCGE